MSDSLKNFPPSEYKLRQLRRSGIVPFSSDVTSFAVVLGFLIFLLLLRYQTLPFLAETLVKRWSAASFSPLAEQWQTHLFEFFQLTAAPLLLILIAVFLCTAYQTRFLFAVNLLSPSFARLFQARGASFRSRFFGAAAAVLKVLAWLGIAALACGGVFAGLLASDSVSFSFEQVIDERYRVTVLEHAADSCLVLLALAFGFALSMAAAGRFLAVLKFQQDHRMSRAEIDAEMKEVEVGAAVRQEQRERFEEVEPENEPVGTGEGTE